MASSRTKSSNSHFSTCHLPPSLTPSPSLSSSGFAYSTAFSCHSRYASSSVSAFTRSTSSTRVSLSAYSNKRSQSPPTIRFSITSRPTSPGRSLSIKQETKGHHANAVSSSEKRTCLCSPTTHPGSFRCALHRSLMRNRHGGIPSSGGQMSSSFHKHSSSALNLRRSAMTNLLVRIGGVEGELMKRSLSSLIRPSSHQLRRRAAFEPRPSRLSIMSKAEDL